MRRLLRLVLLAVVVGGVLLAVRQVLAPPAGGSPGGRRPVPGSPDTWPPVPRNAAALATRGSS